MRSIEILIVISILAMLTAVGWETLSSYNAQQAVHAGVEQMVTALLKARAATLAGAQGLSYGVHIDATSTTVFVGPLYSAQAVTNQRFAMPLGVIAVPSLRGGVSDLLFGRVTGEALNYGTVGVQIAGFTAASRTVTVEQTGVVWEK